MTSYEIAILCYRIVLGALMLGIIVKGTIPMKRTVVTLLAVYFLQMGLAGLFWPAREFDLAMIGVNALGAFIIAYRPAGKIQAIIGCTFIPQMLIHLGRYMNGDNTDMERYFWGLSILGFVQLALAGGWWLHGNYRRHLHRRPDPPVVGPHRQSMAR